MEDVRAHENKGRYLADLVAQGHPTLVVVRKGLEAFAAGIVAGGRDLTPPGNLAVRNWTELATVLAGRDGTSILAEFQEIALFTPPPGLEVIRLLLAGPARCHVVFGQEDLEEESRHMKSLQITREVVGEVFRALRGMGPTFRSDQYRGGSDGAGAQRLQCCRGPSLRAGPVRDGGRSPEGGPHLRAHGSEGKPGGVTHVLQVLVVAGDVRAGAADLRGSLRPGGTPPRRSREPGRVMMQAAALALAHE